MNLKDEKLTELDQLRIRVANMRKRLMQIAYSDFTADSARRKARFAYEQDEECRQVWGHNE